MPIYDILGVVVIAIQTLATSSQASGYLASTHVTEMFLRNQCLLHLLSLIGPLELQQPLAHLTTTGVQQLLTGFTTTQA